MSCPASTLRDDRPPKVFAAKELCMGALFGEIGVADEFNAVAVGVRDERDVTVRGTAEGVAHFGEHGAAEASTVATRSMSGTITLICAKPTSRGSRCSVVGFGISAYSSSSM
jgi:hypothetical protein